MPWTSDPNGASKFSGGAYRFEFIWKMHRKMIIFEKSFAFAKVVIFTVIFPFHFRRSFKLRSDA
jgi:hypothetical protein